jgi:hypothetical protein
VVLTARDETRGTAAVEKLKGLGISGVVFHQLDITNASSIAGLADFLKTRFGKLDILESFSFPSVQLHAKALGNRPVIDVYSLLICR